MIFFKAIEVKDEDKALSFFADDGDWTAPEGFFNGKEELKLYLKWMSAVGQKPVIAESNNGFIIRGNKAFSELKITSMVRGKKIEYLELNAWEFNNDTKIKHFRVVYDRLFVCKQAAKGPIEKTLVNFIVSQTEKGLH